MNNPDNYYTMLYRRNYHTSCEAVIMRVIQILMLFMLLTGAFSIYADSMRCGTKLVDTGDTKADVLMRCGEPMLKEVLGSEITGNQFRSDSDIKSGENTDRDEIRFLNETTEMDEQWTYNPGWGKFLQLVIFRGGRVESIKDGPRVGK
jgi:hypothetical protein